MAGTTFRTASDVVDWIRGHNDDDLVRKPQFAFGSRLYKDTMVPVEEDVAGMKVVSTFWVKIFTRLPDTMGPEGAALTGSRQMAILPVPKWPEESNEDAISMFGLRLNLALTSLQRGNTLPLVYVNDLQAEIMPSAGLVNFYNLHNSYGIVTLEHGQGENYVATHMSEANYSGWKSDAGDFLHPLILPLLLDGAEEQAQHDGS